MAQSKNFVITTEFYKKRLTIRKPLLERIWSKYELYGELCSKMWTLYNVEAKKSDSV